MLELTYPTVYIGIEISQTQEYQSRNHAKEMLGNIKKTKCSTLFSYMSACSVGGFVREQ